MSTFSIMKKIREFLHKMRLIKIKGEMRKLLIENSPSVQERFQIDNLDKVTSSLLAATKSLNSDKTLRQSFGEFNLHYDLSSISLPEPQSPFYQAMVIDLYQRIAKRKYNPIETELSDFTVAKDINNSYPYCTRNPKITALNMIMIATTLGLCNGLPQMAKILEFGPGWGELTITLARLGFNVTCIDIDEKFLKLIRRKTEMFELKNVTMIQGDFLSIEHLEDRFDALIFFESFHHEPFHRELLQHCVTKLKPHGIIIFAGEPITPDNEVPWGLRLDGQSLWSIARNGWMELGFRSEYFEKMLHDLGLLFVKQSTNEINYSTYLAARNLRLDFSSARFATLVGKSTNTGMESTGQSGILVYGPYMHLNHGYYKLKCFFTYQRQPNECDKVNLHIWHNEGKRCLITRHLHDSVPEVIEFDLDRDVLDIEFVIEVAAESNFTFHYFELSRK